MVGTESNSFFIAAGISLLSSGDVQCYAELNCSVMSYSLRPNGRPPDCSVYEDSSGKNTGVGCHDLLQGIFLTRGSKPGVPHCRQILYHLSHQESPVMHGTYT